MISNFTIYLPYLSVPKIRDVYWGKKLQGEIECQEILSYAIHG